MSHFISLDQRLTSLKFTLIPFTSFVFELIYNNMSDSLETESTTSRIGEVKSRIDRLQVLRKRLDEASQANRQEIYAEKQSKRINQRAEVCSERKSKIATKLLAQKEAEERGEDYERKKYWNYSIESVENWEKKQEKVDKRKENSFTDYNQTARKKYKRLVSELTPDLEEHNRQKLNALNSAKVIKIENGEKVLADINSSFYRDANSLHFASIDNQPSDKAVDRLVDDVYKQIERREKYSRKKSIDEDSNNVTYVNERNRKFNGKVNRFFDKYTREIRENLERGTA
ncbi:11029_t:CDS:2 [Diversispora eburnea]|uniref:Pre-mRNA-splicing factor SYF2 n=1 Tax=Diversispora eburnea TaxID=1213867 RepID=A0A9N8V0I8_9GLOM|nr:11029_t:CDS:2 [Diversispora eburnea]